MKNRSFYDFITKAEQTREPFIMGFMDDPEIDSDICAIAHSKDLFFGAAIYDFEFDSYFIASVSALTAPLPISSATYKVCTENFDPNALRAPVIHLDSWASALSSPYFKGRLVSVEGYRDKEDYCLYGIITEVKLGSFTFASFDQNGEWEPLERELPYSSLKCVYFDNNYLNKWQSYLMRNKVFAAFSEKDERHYTYLRKLFEAFGDELLKYNWLITDCECCPSDEILRKRLCGEYALLSGNDLLEILKREDFQWIWGVLSAIPKDASLDDILRYPLPSAERTSLFGVFPSIAHPLAVVELVAFDSTYLYISSKDKYLFDRFIETYPKSETMLSPEYSEI